MEVPFELCSWQSMVVFFAASIHLSRHLRKQKFTSTGLWIKIGGYFLSIFVFFFQGPLVVVVVMIDGSEKCKERERESWHYVPVKARLHMRFLMRYQIAWNRPCKPAAISWRFDCDLSPMFRTCSNFDAIYRRFDTSPTTRHTNRREIAGSSHLRDKSPLNRIKNRMSLCKRALNTFRRNFWENNPPPPLLE